MRLRPSQVILDSENPRLPGGTTSDREAINRLLDDGADALINLARDMARTGQTNPAELPIAVKEGPKYLILEGNRRFAALKLLKDPELAESDAHKQAFRRAAALGTPPAAVFTLVTTSREAAEHWIFLRHTGENDGRGVKRWNATQTAAHRRRANRAVDSGTLRGITIADELEEAYSADAAIIDLIRKARKKKITNIGRFFSSEVLARLGLVIRGDNESNLRPRTLWANHTAEQFRNFFAWSIKYIEDHSVDAYKNPEIRRKVLDGVAHLIPRESDRLPQLTRLASSRTAEDDDLDTSSFGGDHKDIDADPIGDEDAADPAPDSSPTKQHSGDDSAKVPAGTKKRDAKPDRYVFQGLKLPNHPDRVQSILRECRQLEIELFPGIACIMARVVVELSVSADQVLALTGAQESEPLKKKIFAVLRYLDPDFENPRKADKQLEQAHLEVKELGILYMNAFVHNPNLRPDQHLARRFTSAFRPLLQRIDGALTIT